MSHFSEGLKKFKYYVRDITNMQHHVTAIKKEYGKHIMINEYYTTEQLAERLTISKKTLERMRGNGTGPKFNKAGHRVLYSLTNIENWLSENEFTSTSAHQVHTTQSA